MPLPTWEDMIKIRGPAADWFPDLAGGWGTLIFFLIHLAIAAIILGGGIIPLASRLHRTLVTPTHPPGWNGRDYDGDSHNRKSLQQYALDKAIPDATPMVAFSVATANFGGIFTEDADPWIGSVSAEAARLQVDAGARALILDIWPDPADPTSPIVAAMTDMNEWGPATGLFAGLKWWRDHGLGKGVGTYSNWQKLTRNTAPLGDILTQAMVAAFQAPAGSQNGDPFFLILNLHGAMTTAYLSRLAILVSGAVGPYNMGADWVRAKGQKNLCTESYKTFLNKAFVIVCPDIDPAYNSLPNTTTWDTFATQFLASDMGEVTNALERGPSTIHFRPDGIAALKTANQANCVNGGAPITLPAAGFCVVQPTIGGNTTQNDKLFGSNNYSACLATGAQFVAVNLFSPKKDDGALTTFFDPAQFGTYSFKKGV